MKICQFGLVALLLVPAAARAQDNAQDNVMQTAPATTDQDRTISWYMDHGDARKATITRCDDDPGHLANDPDCINAKKADNQAGVDQFKSGVNNTIQGAADFVHKF